MRPAGTRSSASGPSGPGEAVAGATTWADLRSALVRPGARTPARGRWRSSSATLGSAPLASEVHSGVHRQSGCDLPGHRVRIGDRQRDGVFHYQLCPQLAPQLRQRDVIAFYADEQRRLAHERLGRLADEPFPAALEVALQGLYAGAADSVVVDDGAREQVGDLEPRVCHLSVVAPTVVLQQPTQDDGARDVTEEDHDCL